MFTGITRGTFEVKSVEQRPGLLCYCVELDAAGVAGLVPGASVSIDGVCQTVVSVRGLDVCFEAIQETLERSTLCRLRAGQRVALERSSRVGDEIGGHDVAGHVIGTGEVVEAHRNGHICELRIGVPEGWMKYVFQKGFIAVDGSSLTVVDPRPEGSFAVHLIPETLRLTNLGHKRPGDRVNVELDARTVTIVDTVERVLGQRFEREEGRASGA